MTRILTKEQVQKVKLFFKRIEEVEGHNSEFDVDTISKLTGTYRIIEQAGNGDPIKAANWRLKLRGSI